jgi:hypothetical protein
MGQQDSSFYLMDGRALYSVERAIVLETCDTLEEAVDNINNYGADTCIVDAQTGDVIWSLSWGSPLTHLSLPRMAEKQTIPEWK